MEGDMLGLLWSGLALAAPLCSPSSAGEVGWLARSAASPAGPAIAAASADATADFRALYARAEQGDALPADAGDYDYLLVKGLFGDHMPGYFAPALARLRHDGLDAEIVAVDTDASVDVNAAFLRDAIRAHVERTGRKVVVVGHSKGGVDALAALALYPDLAGDVRAVITLQSPYAGSPIATDLEGCAPTRAAVGVAVRGVLGGEPASVSDLTYASRRAFLAAHPLPDVPVVSLATSRPPERLELLGPSEAYLLRRYDVASDGLVVPEDAIVPGSRAVVLDDLSHPESVLRGVGGHGYSPAAIVEAAVALALS